MHDPISEDDPRLTAYALGELDDAEREEFETRLESDAAARARVDEIRATAAFLQTALEDEPVSARATPATRTTPAAKREPGSLIRFPHFYYIVSGLAAACFAVAFVISQSEEAKNAAIPSKHVVRHETRGSRVTMPQADPENAIALQPARAAGLSERFYSTAESTTSSFPLHVRGDSYARVRDALQRGQTPPKEQVQVAEMINAFNYSWPAPAEGHAFSTILEAAPAPWQPENRLVRVGLKGHGPAHVLLASDAQVQVEFNAQRVRSWRLLGFERNGVAGVGSNGDGETLRGDAVVTALYEVRPAQPGDATSDASWLTLSLRYKDGESGAERLLAARLDRAADSFEQASADFRFIASIAAFGFALKESPMEPQLSSDQIIRMASASTQGRRERQEFVGLVENARQLVR